MKAKTRTDDRKGLFARGLRLSFGAQMLLVFILCLTLVGTGMVFLNAWVIAGLKDRLRAQAVYLAEDHGRRMAREIRRLMDRHGATSLAEMRDNPDLGNQVRIVFEGNESVLAVCVLDEKGEVVLAQMGEEGRVIEARTDGDEMHLDIDPSDVTSLRVALRRSRPETRSFQREFKISNQDDESLGRLQFLISENAIYRDIEATGGEITRRLWSVVLAFCGVLALGLYLMARLSRRQMQLLGENETLGRMAYVGTLASGLAHEIRNPLNAMSVNVSVAREEIETGDEQSAQIVRDALELIGSEVERLNGSVGSFLAFARPDTNRRQRTEIRPLVDEIVGLLETEIAANGIEVEVRVPEDAVVEADFGGLRQVLYNVLLNAIQAMAHTEAPRQLTVDGRRESAQWRLWVEDTGPGIPDDQTDKVFEAFHTTKAAGSGLGLAIARAILDSHDGEIRAHARPEGGARMEIVLPETGGRPS